MERDDLRWWNDLMGVHFPVSDADLASLGYVKLNGIDVDRAWQGSNLLRQCIRPIEGRARELLNDTLDTLDRVLAAIDQEDTDG